jgi:hypothetical protein
MRALPGIVAIRVARRVLRKVVMASGVCSRFVHQLGGWRLAIRKRTVSVLPALSAPGKPQLCVTEIGQGFCRLIQSDTAFTT